MNTILVHGWADLESLVGIKSLTGESCAYSMRLLCDVNEDGLTFLHEYLGVPSLSLHDNWNSTVNEQPAIGSIMLSRDMLKPLVEFALFSKGAYGIATAADGTVMGLMDAEALEKYSQTDLNIRRNYRQLQNAPMVGSRNVHQMTGRTA